MAVTYATVSRTPAGVTPQRQFSFYPMTGVGGTELNIVTIAAEDYEHPGPFEVTTTPSGAFEIDLPTGLDQGVVTWKIVETPIDRIPGRAKNGLAPALIGYATITADIGYAELIENLIDVIVVDDDLVANVGDAAAATLAARDETEGMLEAAVDAAANADSSADIASDAETTAVSAASTATTAAGTATTKAGEATDARDQVVDLVGAAEAVAVSNDTIIAGRINDSASATATALSATVVGRVEPFALTLNPDGSVATETVGGLVTTYTYNTDGTINTATRGGVTLTYSYDTAGNMTGAA